MSDYKQCPNGHYYQGDHCPYCKPGRTAGPISIGQQRPQDEWIFVSYVRVKACPNRHAYDKNKQECPICGSKEVISVYECRNSVHHDVIFVVPEVKINGEKIYGVQSVRMCVSKGNTYDYAFVDQMKEAHSFYPEDELLVGATQLKGREIMRMCDLAMDNNLSVLVDQNKIVDRNEGRNNIRYKQCPNEHYYQGDHCPYCNSGG